MHHNQDYNNNPVMEWFVPYSHEVGILPEQAPHEIVSEYRAAEVCSSLGAYRAASALLRSCLEKTFILNGYNTGNLKDKIDRVSEDGIITSARKNKAHDDIRVLGNNILHDDWRTVDFEEYKSAHHYVQRILEDFYDDKEEVEKILISKSLIQGT